MSRRKASFPFDGFIDFSDGQSPLAITEETSLESALTGGIRDRLSEEQAVQKTERIATSIFTGASAGGAASGVCPADTGSQSSIVEEGRKHIGKPYVFGAAMVLDGPDPSKFDCSSFSGRCIYKGTGITPPRTAAAQQQKFKDKTIHEGGTITAEEMKTLPQPGDIIFWQGTYKAGVSHVGICVGEGSGKVIHASSLKGVIEMEMSGYLYDHYHSIVRVAESTSGSVCSGGVTAGVGIGVGKKPDFIPENDWQVLLKYADGVTVDPYLIAAIGWQETHWGKLGLGRKGYTLGMGATESGNISYLSGLESQISEVADRLKALADCAGHMLGQDLNDIPSPWTGHADDGAKSGPADLVWIQTGAKPGGELAGPSVAGKRPWSKESGVYGYHTGDLQAWYANVKKKFLELQELR